MDFGYCLYHFDIGVVFCGWRTFVTYQTYVLETRWWHGAEVTLPRLLPLFILKALPAPVAAVFGYAGSGAGGGDSVEGTDLVKEARSGWVGEGGSILAGLELSPASAVAMSNAAASMGRPRGLSLQVRLHSRVVPLKKSTKVSSM